jgi:adenylate kinase
MNTRLIKIALLGAPGSGKGTQAKLLVDRFHANHVSSGDVLRREVANKTEFGRQIKTYMDKGEIGPAELITEVVLSYLDGLPKTGFVLDGFPRTLYQAEALSRRHAIDMALVIDVPEESVVARIIGRRICPRCSSVFHVENTPPKQPGICDTCGDKLVTRDDDNEETVRRRMKVFAEETKPVIDYYAANGLLRRVQGDGPPRHVFQAVLKLLF